MSSKLQNKLLKELRKKDIFAFSLNAGAISRAGLPDVLILGDGNTAVFAEIKEPGDRLSRLQEETIEVIKGLGYPVFVIRNKVQIEELVSLVRGL